MKKLINTLFILSTIFIISCGSDDNNNNSNNNASITPPSWIEGRWILEYSQPPYETGFYFTNNDFGQITIGGDVSQVQLIENILNSLSAPSNVYIVDTETSNTYTVTLNSGGGDVTYTFNKQSNTEMTWEESSSTALYIKQ